MVPVEVTELTKDYGTVVANDGVSFTVERGEIFGYLGPNGAGKTTTIRMLLGLVKPTSGTAKILGADICDRKALTSVKHNVGYLPDTLGFDEQLTGHEVLDFFAGLRGDARRDELLELFTPPLDRPVRDYSSGNRRMLGIVQAFMHDPAFVIMDEPTAGLDPLKQDQLHQFIEQERDAGKTIFFSSHVLSEVQRVCDRVGIIRDGSIVALEDIHSLLERSVKEVWVLFEGSVDPESVVTDSMIDVTITDNALRCTYTGEPSRLLSHLTGFPVRDVEIGNPQLDTIFKHYYRGETGAGDV